MNGRRHVAAHRGARRRKHDEHQYARSSKAFAGCSVRSGISGGSTPRSTPVCADHAHDDSTYNHLERCLGSPPRAAVMLQSGRPPSSLFDGWFLYSFGPCISRLVQVGFCLASHRRTHELLHHAGELSDRAGHLSRSGEDRFPRSSPVSLGCAFGSVPLTVVPPDRRSTPR